MWKFVVSLALVGLAACAVRPPVALYHPPPMSEVGLGQAGVQVRFLGAAKARACGAAWLAQGGLDVLLQQAIYTAIESMPDADNLAMVRSSVSAQGNEVCIDVSGRAYRLVNADDGSPGPARGAADERVSVAPEMPGGTVGGYEPSPQHGPGRPSASVPKGSSP